MAPARSSLPAATSGHDYSRPGKPEIAWDDPAARDELVSALVNDALAVLAGIEERHPDGAGLDARAAEAVALLALVAGQDVEPAEDSDGTDGRWRIARQVAPDRVISTVDPDARHAHKTRERRQDGFKAHVVVEPDTGLITDTGLTRPAARTTATPPSGSPCSPATPPWTPANRRARSRCWPTRPTAPATRSPRSTPPGTAR